MNKFEGPTLNGAPDTIFRASLPGAYLLGADAPLGVIMQATQAVEFERVQNREALWGILLKKKQKIQSVI